MNSIVPDVRCQKPSKLFGLEKGHLPSKTRKCLDMKVNMDTSFVWISNKPKDQLC